MERFNQCSLNFEDLKIGNYISQGMISLVSFVSFPDYLHHLHQHPQLYVIKITGDDFLPYSNAEIDALSILNSKKEAAERSNILPLVSACKRLSNPMDEVASCIAALLRTLEFAHSLGVMNLDIHENNFISGEDPKNVVIIDWNGAKVFDPQNPVVVYDKDAYRSIEGDIKQRRTHSHLSQLMMSGGLEFSWPSRFLVLVVGFLGFLSFYCWMIFLKAIKKVPKNFL